MRWCAGGRRIGRGQAAGSHRLDGEGAGDAHGAAVNAQAEGGQSDRALRPFGHSNDQRSDLLQCKQTLATLDPGGVPLLRATVAGNRADAPLYVPRQDLVALLGHAHFLLVANGAVDAWRWAAA